MNNKTIIIFGVVIIVAIYVVYTSIIGYTSTMNSEPILISGNKSGTTPLQIPAKRIKRSEDGEYGVEFTYSFWLHLNSISTTKHQHIFHKGVVAEQVITTDKPKPVSIQAPGVWLAKGKNKLIVNMNTFKSVKETCEIDNLPMNKWFHITIVLMNKYVDIYVNGRLKKRCKLNGIPKQNYNDLFINMYGGFDGIISKFRYFAKALPYFRIAQIVKEGPAASNCIDTGDAVPPYLASDYWLQPDYPETPTPVTPVLGKCIGKKSAGVTGCGLLLNEIDCCNSTNFKTCIWQNKDGIKKCSEPTPSVKAHTIAPVSIKSTKPNKSVKKLESSLVSFKKKLFG